MQGQLCRKCSDHSAVSRKSCAIFTALYAIWEAAEPGPEQKSASHSKRKFADHKLEEKEESERIFQSCGAGYYEKIK
jgi:hypothetical protein